MKESFIIKMLGGGCVAGLTFLFGSFDLLLQILLWMIVADYLTGFLAGAFKKELSSKIGYKGIAKKVMILIIVVVAVQLDKMTGNTNGWIRLTVISFYISNEVLSIIENADRIGLPLPSFLKTIVKAIREKSDQSQTGRDVI